MLWWLTSLLLTSFVCWGSHTFNYLPYCYMLNMTATNTTSYNTCIKGSDGKGVMTKIFVGALNKTDGAGGVSAANRGECCIIDASTSPMPSGWSNQSTVSVNFKLWNTDILCPTGYFLNGINIAARGVNWTDQTSMWQTLNCIKPSGPNFAYLSTSDVPFRDAFNSGATTFVGCPNGSFIIGFHTAPSSANNSISGDLLDIDYLKCGVPSDISCPALNLASNMQAIGNGIGGNCSHQYCTRTLTCAAGYSPNISDSSILWNPPLNQYNMSSFAEGTYRRDPRLVSYTVTRPTEEQLRNYTYGTLWTWSPVADQGYLEIDLGVPRTVTGVVTLGGCGDPMWRLYEYTYVTNYSLFYTNTTNPAPLIINFQSPILVDANVDGFTPRVYQLSSPVVARRFILNITGFNSHVFLRADLYVKPLPYIMVKEAVVVACGVNYSMLASVAAACDGQKYSCNVTLNTTLYPIIASCQMTAILGVDWFYNGVPQTRRNISQPFTPFQFNVTTAGGALPTSLMTCRPDLGVWTGVNMTCNDLNECQRKCGLLEVGGECHNCDENISTCANTAGNYTCTCFPGYRSVGGQSCVNVNECANACGPYDDPIINQCNNCSSNTNCRDTNGSFVCVCKAGFAPIAGGCAQINECNVNCTNATIGYCNNCFQPNSCVDTNTSFTCSCPSGYTGDGVNCTDVNECNTTANCPMNSFCVNTPGNYTCNCSQGFQVNGSACSDINECTSSPCGAGPCENLPGSFRCPPYIANVRWKRFGNTSWVSGPINLTSLSQSSPDQAEINVSNVGPEFSIPNFLFSYGSAEFPTDFSTGACSKITTNTTQVSTCNMGSGAGKNLSFTLTYCVNGSCVSGSAPSFPFSYPPPTLLDGSLRFLNSDAGSSSLNTSAQFGVNVWMNGTNFYTSASSTPQFTVTFGANNYSCTFLQSSSTALQCNTGAFSGTLLAFRITVGRGSSAQVFQGGDRISFVNVNSSNASCPYYPTIVNVSGCATNNNGQTSECPTQGGVQIQVTAQNALSRPVLVYVGGVQATVLNLSTDNLTLTCILPVGEGRNVGVIVGHASPPVFSLTSFSVSYAAPSISSITSSACTSVDNFTLTNCLAGAATLSIVGINFGAAGALVVAGGVSYNATHDTSYPDQALSIPFPPWKSGVSQVIVFARSGLKSGSAATYTFSLCPPGSSGTGNVCTNCASGRFTNTSGQAVCTLCDVGTYQPNSGRSSCVACDPGTYSSLTGGTNCTRCVAGTWAVAMASTCTNCPPGQYSSSNQASSCTLCAVGWMQPAGGKSTCIQCVGGTFSSSPGQASCAACPPGTKGVGVGQSSCQACPAGRYQSSSGAQDCIPCVVGMYSGLQAQHCLMCPSGTISNSNGTVDCTSCQPGTFQSNGGMSECESCTPGTFAANPGQVACDACPPGRATKSMQQISCQDCKPGEFQSSDGAESCVQCPAGAYSSDYRALVCKNCQAGQAQVLTGMSSCVPCGVGTFRGVFQLACENCTAGSYQTALGQASCIPCVAGWYSNSSLNCEQCPPGKYSLGTATACTDCERGYYGLPHFGQTECFPCSVGRFSNDTSATSCEVCLGGKFSSKPASVECAECATGKFSAAESKACTSCYSGRYAAGETLDDCLTCPPGATVFLKAPPFCRCLAGQYSVEYKNSRGLVEYSCVANPAGTRTDQAGITEPELVTLSGYWRSSNATLSYYRCYAPQFCLGGLNSDCAPFREGPVCSLCKPGYKSAGSTRECVPCPALVESSVGITIAILLAVGIALILAYWLILKMADAQQREMLEKHKKSQETAMASVAAATAVGDKFFVQLRAEIQNKPLETGEEEEEEEEEQDAVKKQEEVITYGQRRAPNFMYKIKIVVSFYQIASLFPAQGGIHWPQQFVDFINFFSFFNFDFIPWQNLSCAVTIDYYSKILIVGLLPIGLVLALAAFFSLSLIYYGRNDDLCDQMVKQNRVLRIKRQFTKCVLFTIFLLYPFVSRTALGVYNCFTVEGVRYLAADFSLLCDAPEWTVAAGYTSIFVLLYPIGTPLIYFYLMRQADRRSPDAFLELGFLYEAYVDERWYWELLDMGHKLLLTSIVVFLPSEIIMGANMVVIVVYLILLLVCHPYLRKGDDRLHLLGQVNLFVLALMGHALRSLDDPFESPLASRSAVEQLLAAMLILINLIFLLSFLIIAGRNVKKAVADYMKKRQLLLKEDAAAQSSSAPPSASPSAPPSAPPSLPPSARPSTQGVVG